MSVTRYVNGVDLNGQCPRCRAWLRDGFCINLLCGFDARALELVGSADRPPPPSVPGGGVFCLGCPRDARCPTCPFDAHERSQRAARFGAVPVLDPPRPRRRLLRRLFRKESECPA